MKVLIHILEDKNLLNIQVLLCRSVDTAGVSTPDEIKSSFFARCPEKLRFSVIGLMHNCTSPSRVACSNCNKWIIKHGIFYVCDKTMYWNNTTIIFKYFLILTWQTSLASQIDSFQIGFFIGDKHAQTKFYIIIFLQNDENALYYHRALGEPHVDHVSF